MYSIMDSFENDITSGLEQEQIKNISDSSSDSEKSARIEAPATCLQYFLAGCEETMNRMQYINQV